MKQLIKKYWLILVIIISSTICLGGYFAYKSLSNNFNSDFSLDIDSNSPDSEKDTQKLSDEIFPKIKVRDFYKYLELNENSRPIITKKFIAIFIQAIINGMSKSTGNVRTEVKGVDTNLVNIFFRWTGEDNQVASRNYRIETKLTVL